MFDDWTPHGPAGGASWIKGKVQGGEGSWKDEIPTVKSHVS